MKVLLVHNFHRAHEPSGEDIAYRRERELLRTASGVDLHTYERSNDEPAARSALGAVRAAVRLPHDPVVYADLRAHLRALRPDLVHVHNTFPLLTPAIFTACYDAGVPAVQTLHNHYLFCARGMCDRDGRLCTLCLDTRNPWHAVRFGCYNGSRLKSLPVARMIQQSWLDGSYVRHTSGYIALSEDGRARFERAGLPPERLHVKPHFLPDPGPPDAAAPREGVLYVGRLTEEKGLHVLLDAAARLPAGVPVHVVGDGPGLGALRASAPPAVTFHGPQPNDVCLRMAREAAVLAVPSVCPETFGLTVIEAYASGTPVVASRLGSLAELVADGVTGRTVAPGDAAALAAALASLTGDAAAARAMGAAARAHYEARYTPEANLAQLLAIYERVLADRPAVSRGTASTSP